MFQLSHLSSRIVLLLKIVSLSVEIQYEFEFEDDQVFSKCLDNPRGLEGIEGLFDFSDLTRDLGEEGVLVSGNLTTVWEVEPTDRIELRSNTLHYERGFWQPTILNILVSDLCNVLYDEKQLWFSVMMQHVINVKDVRGKCFKYKGTLLMFEPYLLKAKVGIGMVLAPGRYRIITHMVAIDVNNVTRPNELCFETNGHFFKILNQF